MRCALVPDRLDVIELATEAGVHPAVVAGRVRFERGDYRLLSQFVGSREVRGQFEERYEQSGN